MEVGSRKIATRGWEWDRLGKGRWKSKSTDFSWSIEYLLHSMDSNNNVLYISKLQKE
jgi:hypothetical protein